MLQATAKAAHEHGVSCKEHMKKLVLILVFALQGCGVYECIDMNFERETKPIDQDFNVVLEFQDKTMSKIVQCEEYYDAICAERGNYWAIREVGTESENRVSSFEFIDSELGVVKIPLPSCSDMVKGKNIPLKSVMPRIDGKTYWLKSTDGLQQVYKAATPKGEPEKTVKVKLSLEIDNVPLK